jgi:DNA/RNA endonuclease YhcR with UshA esterase domain
MLIEPINIAAINANTFEDPVTVKQAVVEDRNLRVRGINILTVKINNHG